MRRIRKIKRIKNLPISEQTKSESQPLPNVQLILDAAEELHCAEKIEERAAKRHFRLRMEVLGVAQLFDWTGFD